MIKRYCDICGKELQDKTVVNDTDPLDYYYGEFDMEFGIALHGKYELKFDDVCHECAKKIQSMSINDFKTFFVDKILGITKDKGRKLTKEEYNEEYCQYCSSFCRGVDDEWFHCCKHHEDLEG